MTLSSESLLVFLVLFYSVWVGCGLLVCLCVRVHMGGDEIEEVGRCGEVSRQLGLQVLK